MAPPTGSGANPAPLYKEKTNAIAELMSQHTSSSALSFLSSLPSRNSTNANGARPKTAAQEAAAAEDYDLDRLAQYDDNMGVGMFAPENRTEKEETRKKELEDRRLKARLGLLGKGKRKGSEWEVASGVSKAREQESDDEEEMGRSGVGRAKKRKRIVAGEDVANTKAETRDHEGNLEITQDATLASHEVQKSPEREDDTEMPKMAESGDGDLEAISQVAKSIGDQLDTVTKAKRKRKKAKKKKPKV
ncbi:hypothetical protein AB5N19_13161 [Seiridium cardinale]|uniref:Uncharacterized protein n=1 Tax=Seiridium cardinale TaxID=138064 RepID=A0ABR2XF36_9PEZI